MGNNSSELIISMYSSQATNILNEKYYFKVPIDISSIELKITKTIENYFTMIVVDSKNRLRGQFLYGGKDSLLIHEETMKSTPYTISGNIPDGNWYISVVGEGDFYPAIQEWGKVIINFNPEITKEFDSEIFIDTNSYPYLKGFNNEKIYDECNKWYKGDLHTHTIYSDGKMTQEELANSARKENLDFIVNTDHNIATTSWPKGSNLLIIPGTEVSFYHGHANILNLDQVVYKKGSADVITSQSGVLDIFSENYGENSIMMINHPFLDEWTWQYGETKLKDIDALEVINSPTLDLNNQANEWALIAWDYLLQNGVKITGVGGSDIHGAPGNESGEKVGDPTTYIYSDNLSAQALMRGVKAGNVIVSRELFIDFSFKDYLPGDTIHERTGTLLVSIETSQPLIIEIIVDGVPVKTVKGNSLSYTFSFCSEYHYIRSNVRYLDGKIAGFTNPFYFGKRKNKIDRWQSVIEYINNLFPETIQLFHE